MRPVTNRLAVTTACLLKDVNHQILRKLHDGFRVHESHLHVQLCELQQYTILSPKTSDQLLLETVMQALLL